MNTLTMAALAAASAITLAVVSGDKPGTICTGVEAPVLIGGVQVARACIEYVQDEESAEAILYPEHAPSTSQRDRP
jgi:hypothetical protein